MTDASSVLGSQLCDVVSVAAVQSALSLPHLQSAHPAGGKVSTPGYESAHYNDDCSYGNYPDLAPPSGQANVESVRLGLHVSTDEEATFAMVANRAVTESERGPSENFKVGDLIGSTFQMTLAPDVDSSMATRGVVTELPLNGNSYISLTVQVPSTVADYKTIARRSQDFVQALVPQLTPQVRYAAENNLPLTDLELRTECAGQSIYRNSKGGTFQVVTRTVTGRYGLVHEAIACKNGGAVSDGQEIAPTFYKYDPVTHLMVAEASANRFDPEATKKFCSTAGDLGADLCPQFSPPSETSATLTRALQSAPGHNAGLTAGGPSSGADSIYATIWKGDRAVGIGLFGYDQSASSTQETYKLLWLEVGYAPACKRLAEEASQQQYVVDQLGCG